MKPFDRTYIDKLTRSEIKLEHYSWWDYYDYVDYDDDYKDYGYFEYINKDVKEEIFLETVCGPRHRRLKNMYLPYRAIDMNSIYSKQVRRNKLIDELLGFDKAYKPKFEDIINENSSKNN
jgi:hypothetical protein